MKIHQHPWTPLAVLVLAVSSLGASTWVETTAPDFSDGRWDSNLYASVAGGGAVEFAPRYDLDNDGYIDLVCPDDSGPYLRVYFGSATGYDSARSRYYRLPNGGGGVDAADLNADGFTDLVASAWRAGQVNVYWGTASGPSPTDTCRLRTPQFCEAVTVYDLDRDSYLDILAGTTSDYLYVYWGSDTGYSNSNVTTVLLQGNVGHNVEVADFDRDGNPDIAAVPWSLAAAAVVYWGPARAPREIVWLAVSPDNPHGVTVADLDSDDWLDLVFNGYDSVTTAFIYYGSETGFSEANREMVHPGLCYGGSAAAYWDEDSSLDLVFFRGDYNADTTFVPRAYLNDPAGSPHFSDLRFVEIGTESLNASGGVIADFDQDGHQDVYVDGYGRNESSLVLYGPDWLELDRLPCRRSHHGRARELGHAYDRGRAEQYTSSVFDGEEDQIWCRVSWDDSTPGASSVALELRTGNTETPDPDWSGWVRLANGDSIPDSLTSRYIQYRATLGWDLPTFLPVLHEVRIDYVPVPYHDVGPIELIAPVGILDSGTVVTPRVLVGNLGNQTDTFAVTMNIGTSYTETVQHSLSPGAADTVSFPDWVADPIDTFDIVCFTLLAVDENPANDTLRSEVVVAPPPHLDVGVVEILGPSLAVDSGETRTPWAVVRNFGNVNASFPVTFRIGTTYAETESLTLVAAATDTVRFPAWTATEPDTNPIVCFTRLAGDERPNNDTATGWVFVRSCDVGVAAVIRPTGVLQSGTVIQPRAIVLNSGNSETSFPVTLHVGAVYADTIQVSLLPGTTDTVDFRNWTASPVGSHPVLCYTFLARDRDRSNDTALTSVIVTVAPVYDVAARRIVVPSGTVDSGDVHIPRAVVENLGNVEASFPVTMLIGNDYSETVRHVLGPGETDTVAFPDWTASPIASLTATCYTALAADRRRENDTARSAFTVGPAAVHDIGTAAIAAPSRDMMHSDTVQPRAVIRNYGNRTESNFQVRFWIDTSYSQLKTVTAPLAPDSSVSVTFPLWTARSGFRVLNCSTRLRDDAVPGNDKKTAAITVSRPLILRVESDIADRIPPGRDTVYPFVAVLEGDSGAVIDLEPLHEIVGWDVRFVNASGGEMENSLGYLDTGEVRRFGVKVAAPSEDLSGIREPFLSHSFIIRGFARQDSLVRDHALLDLSLIPSLQIHNFPNPLVDWTDFIIGLPDSGTVSLTIYDRAGIRIRRVLDQEPLAPGAHTVRWWRKTDGSCVVAPGTYHYVFEYGRQGRTQTIHKKLVVTRE